MNNQYNFLENKIINLIKLNGPMNVSEFMEICLYDNDYGYYTNSNVVGIKGDFITSPEISQVFGELIALSIYNSAHLSNLKDINIVELGPGKGTLMKDIINTFAKIRGSNLQSTPLLYEKNRKFIKIQMNNLLNYKCNWINNLSDISNKPTYFIANEFFDALPVNQMISNKGFWYDRKVGIDNNKLCFKLGNQIIDSIEDDPYPNGKIIEEHLFAKPLISQIFNIILKNKGALLVIDYGQVYEELNYKDTIQGVLKHKKSDVLKNIGYTDLSSWVNFSDFIYQLPERMKFKGPITQKQFLINLGIESRFEKLGSDKSALERRKLFNDFERLVSASHMGQAFKVLSLYSDNIKSLEGF